MNVPESSASVARHVGAGVRRIIRRQVPAAGPDAPLADDLQLGAEGVGLDSVAVVELLLECESVFAVRLPDGWIESGPLTVRALVIAVEQAILTRPNQACGSDEDL